MLPSALSRLVLDYLYRGRNINILSDLIEMFISGNDYYGIAAGNLNRRLVKYKFKTHIMVPNYNVDDEGLNPQLVIDQNDNITDAILSKLILYFSLHESEEAAMPIFYRAGDTLEYIQGVNSVLKHNNSKLRVIPYNVEFVVEKL